ncbi:MAG: hypothetical protein AAF604_03545 [Acidobacteriota bacterium]
MALCATLAVLRNLEQHLSWTVFLLTAGTCGLLWIGRRLEAVHAPTVALLGIALLMRLPLLTLPPTLSDDILRYLWDGRVAAAGQNPYALAPEAAELAPLRDDLWQALPHRQVPTVYPPLAVGLFSIAARLPASQQVLKGALAGADLLAAWGLIAIARRRHWPVARVVLFAWNPLLALESAGMGHIDALGVAATVAVVAALVGPRRDGRAAPLAAAAGILAKLAPVAAVPMWGRQSGRPWRFVLLAGGTSLVAFAPVLLATGGPPPGWLTYGVSWEFNGPLFEPLWRLVDRLGVAAGLHHLLDLVKAGTGHHEGWNRLYPWIYPKLIAKTLLALLMGLAVWRSWRRPDPVRGTAELFAALLLCSATFYPWYITWMMPWAALLRRHSWLLLSALLPLSYLPQFSNLPLMPWLFAAIWGPFFLLEIHRRWSSTG